jgi:hypothetical protein
MALSLDSRQPGTLLVATVDWWKDRDTIWRSADAGRTWTSLLPLGEIDATATPFLRWGETRANFGWWMAGLAIDPFDSNHVAYTTGATVYATDRLVPASNSQLTLWRPWVGGIEETAVLALASPTQGPRQDLDAARLTRHYIAEHIRCCGRRRRAPYAADRVGRIGGRHDIPRRAANRRADARSWPDLDHGARPA